MAANRNKQTFFAAFICIWGEFECTNTSTSPGCNRWRCLIQERYGVTLQTSRHVIILQDFQDTTPIS